MLDFDQVQKLHEAATGTDKAELSLLHSAVIKAMAAYKEKSSAAHMKDWDAAKEGLAERVARLWPKYFPAEAAGADPADFSRQKDALAWLHGKGYKVSAGKFSNDWNNGKLKIQQNRLALADLREYATGLDVDRKKVSGAEQRQARKDQLEIQVLEEKVRRSELENRKDDSRWTLKDDATDQAAALVVVLRNNLHHHASMQTPAVLVAAAGDNAHAPAVEAALLEIIAAAFNDLAASREARLIGLVDVPIDEEDDE